MNDDLEQSNNGDQSRQLFSRIESNPAILHGKPVIAGTRLSVEVLLESLASGDTFDELLEDYPFLSREDIVAAIEYAIHLIATATDTTQAVS
jgi:uncharacterized protein (DUF433 family)